ncbi:hypothetical protein GCM10007989_10240 [Devosia pacifica]|uniref:SH3b domain-containing protein n=2 Tax=Devosia pacifica TaxID=1335967 RepID=A0A918VQM2_9HYPH|nr:hypothetical protein GCM10007989_10240 [Devosia pacifica]
MAQAPTATVTGGNIPVYTGPDTGYRIIGRIPDGTAVTLDYCARDRRDYGRGRGPVEWCLVTDTGWVQASYLVGESAKIRVTPPDFLVDPPIFRPRGPFGDDDDSTGWPF